MATLYVTQAQLIERYRKQDVAGLASDGQQLNVTEAQADTLLLDAAVIARITAARTDASNDVDLYLNGRADMTDPDNQTGVLRIGAALAMAYLTLRKLGLNPQLQAAFEMQYSKLRAMQRREQILTLEPEDPVIETQGTSWERDRLADRCALAGF